MSETRTVVCDNCDADLTYHETGYPVEWALSLSAYAKPTAPDSEQGAIFAVVPASPPIERSHHFCHLPCLAEWIEGRGFAAGKAAS